NAICPQIARFIASITAGSGTSGRAQATPSSKPSRAVRLPTTPSGYRSSAACRALLILDSPPDRDGDLSRRPLLDAPSVGMNLLRDPCVFLGLIQTTLDVGGTLRTRNRPIRVGHLTERRSADHLL